LKERLKKIWNANENFLEKNARILLVLIFIIGLLVYGFLAKKMTSPTFLNIDEELYVSMARSFFYERKFCKKL
jgi:hypothetical protein